MFNLLIYGEEKLLLLKMQYKITKVHAVLTVIIELLNVFDLAVFLSLAVTIPDWRGEAASCHEPERNQIRVHSAVPVTSGTKSSTV